MNLVKPDNIDDQNKENIPQFWEDIYLAGEAQWDLQGSTPIFKNLSNNLPLGNLCIIGCGRGYDAIEFAKKGFKVTAVDFASSAILSLKKMAEDENVSLQIIERDIFTLMPDYENSFDYVIEQTCFCAIHPSRRKEYEVIVKGILKVGGHLVGLWFPLDKDIKEDGPPYGTTIDDVKSIFRNGWEITKEEFSEHSIKPRRGREKLMIFKSIS